MLKVSLQMPAVQFGNWKPAKVVEHTSCDDCFLTTKCNRNAPLCYGVECPSTIAFAEVL